MTARNRTAPQYCSLRIDPSTGRPVYKTTDSLREELRSEMTVDLAARFFGIRDDWQDDTKQDLDRGRANRRVSITRDMISKPGELEFVQSLDDAHLGRAARPTSADPYRFASEATRLVSLRLISDRDMPDFSDDASITKFFDKVSDIVHTRAKQGKARPVIDAAPSIYVFTELLKHVPVLIEEELTELWARRIFPIRNLNTWLPQWSYKRYAKRGSLPQYVDTEWTPNASRQQTERVAPVIRPLVFFDNGCYWNLIELERHAEAVANGAADISLDRDRIDTAVRMMLMKEDMLTFFGDPMVNVFGLFSPAASTGIERITGGPQFNGGSTEDDRQILTKTVKEIIADTEDALRPNTVMLSTFTWLYVNDKRYGDVTADSNQTVAEAALATLSKLGINEFLWVPEVGYSEKQRDRLIAHGMTTVEATRNAGGIGDGKQAMVVCKRDPSVMEMIVAKDRVMYPAREEVHGRVEVRMLQGSGGMEFYRPEGVKIVTDVGPDSVV